MMLMQMKFFEGTLEQIEEKFNSWSNGTQYISHTAMHFKGKDRDQGVMQVIYGGSLPKGKPQKNKRYM
jgi:hypothetical protein